MAAKLYGHSNRWIGAGIRESRKLVLLRPVLSMPGSTEISQV
jgi:hypothetical protein